MTFTSLFSFEPWVGACTRQGWGGGQRLLENFQTRNPHTAGLQSFFLPGKEEKKYPVSASQRGLGLSPKPWSNLGTWELALGLLTGDQAFQRQSLVGSLPQGAQTS